uniref:Uncharacterized protein n=1 Tax=Oryza rufipogon TaxID=4529 RepID=A0A0E0QWF9_ORYRU
MHDIGENKRLAHGAVDGVCHVCVLLQSLQCLRSENFTKRPAASRVIRSRYFTCRPLKRPDIPCKGVKNLTGQDGHC